MAFISGKGYSWTHLLSFPRSQMAEFFDLQDFDAMLPTPKANARTRMTNVTLCKLSICSNFDRKLSENQDV